MMTSYNKNYNPIKAFYRLPIIERYQNFIKSKRVFLSILLIICNILGGLVFGYSLGTIGGSLNSATLAFFPSSNNNNGNATTTGVSFRDIVFDEMIKPKFVVSPLVGQTKISDFALWLQSTTTNVGSVVEVNQNLTTSDSNNSQKPFDLGNSLLQGLFASSIFIGGMVGCFCTMITASYLGRKLCMILCCVIFSIGCIGASASNSYASLIVFRCIMGFGAAISTSVCSVYMAELMPFPKYQGVLGAMYNVGVASGVAFGYAFGAIFLFTSEQWRAVHALGNLFSISLFILLVFVLPESPQFIMGATVQHQQQHTNDKSDVELKTQNEKPTATTTASEQPTLKNKEEPKTNNNKEGAKPMSFLQALKRLFFSKVIISTILACFYCGSLEWTGIQSATLFIPSLLESAGVTSPLYQQLASMGVAIWQIMTIIPCIFLVDRFGRKSITIFGLVISILTNLAIGFVFQFAPNGSTEKIVLALVFIAIFLIGFNVGLGSLVYMLAHEVFNGEHEKVVILGTSISIMCLWFFSIIISLFFIPLVTATNQAVPSYIFAGISFIGLLLTIFLLKETSPRVLAKKQLLELTKTKGLAKKDTSVAAEEKNRVVPTEAENDTAKQSHPAVKDEQPSV
ncbi:hypothetical protein C9374_008621 [Naegleria lovaniensis]|uniref:Major facilitator superfamily (MFS) profile domain-containing protein n=1 Tax=Naegleria lovaniensis TaxID=51637 RepID=A0AA88KKN3_NAELO|nr:uncharacterized protein C9374_008621 [Naegleria lovaniensis]KAG2377999.1 hypothetical protein C9374_008621 [Naegleria lovaniensis]